MALVYIVLGFLASSSEHPPLYAVLVGAVSVAAGLLAAAWRAPWRYAATLLCLAAFAAIGWHIDMFAEPRHGCISCSTPETMIALDACSASPSARTQGAVFAHCALLQWRKRWMRITLYYTGK